MGLEHNIADVLEDLEEHLIGNGIVIDPLSGVPMWRRVIPISGVRTKGAFW